MRYSAIIVSLVVLLMSSCVSKKKFNELTANCDQINIELQDAYNALQQAKSQNDICEEAKSRLEEEIDYLKANNTNLLDRLSDLSVLSRTEAENVKASLEKLNERDIYIKNLQSAMDRKDSLNLLLAMNLKSSLANFDDEDIQVEVKKGVVYVSIADKLLFGSGSSYVNAAAKGVLGKVAKVVADHPEIQVLVESHTDDDPILTDCHADNWDLSVKRSTSIVRVLQKDYNVPPERMTAAGRSEYVPKVSNDTEEGKSINRRTEIILTPKLDEFFKLLEGKE